MRTVELLLLFSFVVFYARCETQLRKQSEILDQLLITKGYDKRLRPSAINGSDGPVIDYVNMFVRDIDLRDDDFTFHVQMTLRQVWNDPRLKYENLDGRIKSITLNDPSKLWIPDIFFANEVKGYLHQLTTPNILIRIYPNGEVLLSTRVTVRLSCDDIQRHFLSETVACSIKLVTYGYTTDNLLLKWKQGGDAVHFRDLYLPDFTMNKNDLAWCTSSTNTGEYSCLNARFYFTRNLLFYVVNVFMPCCCLVFMTWVAFWLDPNAILLRVVFTAIPFSCLVILCVDLVNVLPKTYHITAINVWTGNCFNFVLSAFILVGIINNFRLEEQKISSDESDEEKGESKENEVGGRGSKLNRSPWYRIIFRKECPRSRKYDYIARILFPSTFAFFNLVYWAWLFSQRAA